MTIEGRSPTTAGTMTREEWAFGAVALLLVIDLLAFPWFHISAGPFSINLSATDAPDGWTAVLAVIATVAAIADLGIERFVPQTTVPMLRGSRAETRFVLVAAAVALVALKFVLHIHFSLFGFGFWLALVLCVSLVVLALRARAAGA